ncbi:MAG: ribD [Fibrobacteria bacterium]|jgi:diaminohydroxyphosphoribosylaminopyrimidine deaminase/5-amino-6-(5-phosphoribosylamino)uracil reductase|nr:ribD [Fibrobacteria bacterium]
MKAENYKFTPRDLAFMEMAFAEAMAVKGKTLPNPPVGAVLVKSGKVVGRGGTRPAGEAHAEIVALEQAGAAAAGATLYVTLEPCGHFGRTPPCSRALIEAGVARVIAACSDPNPLVAGAGLAQLRRAGISVETGLLGDRAEALYAGFFFWVRHGRPRIVVKIAQSLDGRINARRGVETALTGPEARRFAHSLRARADAILVGGETVRVDDPDLTPREIPGAPHPEILVLSRKMKPSNKYHIFTAGRKSGTWVISGKKFTKTAKISAKLPEKPEKLSIIQLPEKWPLARELIDIFTSRGYHEVLVEGGRAAWSPFLNAGLCDELDLITAPALHPGGERWDAGLRPGWVKPLEFHRFTPLGSDILAEFRRHL